MFKAIYTCIPHRSSDCRPVVVRPVVVTSQSQPDTHRKPGGDQANSSQPAGLNPQSSCRSSSVLSAPPGCWLQVWKLKKKKKGVQNKFSTLATTNRTCQKLWEQSVDFSFKGAREQFCLIVVLAVESHLNHETTTMRLNNQPELNIAAFSHIWRTGAQVTAIIL